MNTKNLLAGAVTGLWIVLAAGCGGSGSSGDDAPTQVPTPPPPVPTPPPPPVTPPPAPIVNHAVGGSLFGLHGTLVLQNNGSDGLTLTADGPFAFATSLAPEAAYSVSVQTQPANQICTVDNSSGTIAEADVTDVTVNCSTITRIVGGAVSGLDPSESVVLQNNGRDNLAVASDGSFAFATPVAQSGAYNVTVFAQPATQTCSVTNGSGTAGASDIGNVQVTCSFNAYTVGGTLSGLAGTLILQNNSVDDLTLTGDGSFTFSTPVAQSAAYNVTVSTQPATHTCVVTNGSGTMGGTNITNVGLSCTLNTTTLSVSASELALSVTGLTEYGVSLVPPASGDARTITIANTGGNTATNLAVTAPTWPSGTSSSTTCGSTLAATDTCTITVTPGSVASSNGTDPCSLNGTAPQPRSIQVSGDNTNTVTSNVVVLNYGCIYQGGYVYAFDDTTSTTGSVGGKVAATADQASVSSAIIWSSNGGLGTSPGDVSYDLIPGVAETSTPSNGLPLYLQFDSFFSSVYNNPNPFTSSSFSACAGDRDGACNTNNIVTFYNQFVTTNTIGTGGSGPFTASAGPTPLTAYAAGLCKQTISSYSDWYLPAICELGYGSACGTPSSPTLQNMQSNLVDSLNRLASIYWSSTASSAQPHSDAWIHWFDNTGASMQLAGAKNGTASVRCSRAF